MEELINRSPLSLKLYKFAKNIFDNFDFLYAVMRKLDTSQRPEIFNQCIIKNESCLNHTSMHNIFTFIVTANYLKKK